MDAVILDNSEWVCAVCDLWVLVTSYSAFCTTRPGVLWGKSGRLLNPVWLQVMQQRMCGAEHVLSETSHSTDPYNKVFNLVATSLHGLCSRLKSVRLFSNLKTKHLAPTFLLRPCTDCASSISATQPASGPKEGIKVWFLQNWLVPSF